MAKAPSNVFKLFKSSPRVRAAAQAQGAMGLRPAGEACVWLHPRLSTTAAHDLSQRLNCSMQWQRTGVALVPIQAGMTARLTQEVAHG